jgi:YjbE family integral membrane protein
VDFLSPIFRIIIIDLILSGDNAVVIGMAAHRLAPRQRKIAIVLGGGAAIILRIILTAIAALLLLVTGLRLAGGLLLVWIGFKLLRAEESGAEGVKVATSMQEAVVTILLADLIMSLDNVLGVAAASEGHLGLLLFGLVLSMMILMFMGNLVADLVNKIWWLAYVGSGVIVWTGAKMIFEDPLVTLHVDLSSMVEHAVAALVTIGTLGFAHWFHRIRQKE